MKKPTFGCQLQLKSCQTDKLSIDQVCPDRAQGENAVRRQDEAGTAGAAVSRPASP